MLNSRTFLMLSLSMAMTSQVFAQATDDFEVRVNVLESCVITADDLDFGTYDANGLLPTIGVSTITATCTLLTTFDIGIDAGTGGTAVNDRKMVDDATGTETLDYTLGCVGAGVPACVVNWGNTPGTDTFTGIGTGLPIPTVVTGTIAAGQQVTPGTFRDFPVTATVYF